VLHSDIFIIDCTARLSESTPIQILYIESQQGKVIIHGHTEDEITNFDFGDITLRVQGSDGAKADLTFVQTGSRQLGMGRRVDLIFQFSTQERSGSYISDGFGFQFVLPDHDRSGSA
jgi:hypothetical protein